MAVCSLKGKRKIELERCCAVCYGFCSKAKAVGATMSHSECNKKTQTHDRPFCYVILLTKLLPDIEEVSTQRYDSATCFRCVAYYFSVGSAVLLLLLFFVLF